MVFAAPVRETVRIGLQSGEGRTNLGGYNQAERILWRRILLPSTLGWEFSKGILCQFLLHPRKLGTLYLTGLCGINNSKILKNDKVGRHEFSVCCSAADCQGLQ